MKETSDLSTDPSAGSATAPTQRRLVSLDAFRGAIMLLMASGGLGIFQLRSRDVVAGGLCGNC